MDANLREPAQRSAARQVWDVDHLRQTILDDCAESILSPAQRTEFFRRCIGNLDQASTRELARHTHASDHLDDFPFDCPDEVRQLDIGASDV